MPHTLAHTPTTPPAAYCGRFAPTPSGPLHPGSLVAALASWLDARAHHGQWLVRIEDVDLPRCQVGADQFILQQLATCGLHPDAPPVWQSQRHHHYQAALTQLVAAHHAFACACTRKDLEAAWAALGTVQSRHVERPYPGTCRDGLHGKAGRSWRFAAQRYMRKLALDLDTRAEDAHFFIEGDVLHWHDRRLGAQQLRPMEVAGDFLLQRTDGIYAYQLAVVVDDALQGITHIVRGEDLTDNTPRQLLLQHALGTAPVAYLHTPLVRMPDGEKLSKQHGAAAVDLHDPLLALSQAAQALGLGAANPADTIAQALHAWVLQWQAFYNAGRDRYSTPLRC